MIYDILTFSLENGLNVIFHKIPYVRTVSCGIWIKQGSKYEDDETNGISHFIEHLKLTSENGINKDFKKIISDLTLEGVIYNAVTTKEYTSYFFTGLANTFENCIKALSNIAIDNTKFSKDMFEKEKQVVLQEAISFYSSFNQIKERTSQALWGNMDVGRIIVGDINNIKSFDIETVESVIYDSYTPSNSMLVIVGGIDYREIIDIVVENFSRWEDRETREYKGTINKHPDIYLNNNKDMESTVLSIGFKTPSYTDKNRQYIDIISNVLGNPSFESRLVNEIRIKRGLAYNVGSFNLSYENCGTLGLTAVCSKNSVEEVIKIIMEEVRLIRRDEISDLEMNRAKKILETTTLLQLDDITGQLKFLGKSSAYGKIFSLEEEIRSLRKLNKSKVASVAKETFRDENMALAIIGNCDMDRILPLLQIE